MMFNEMGKINFLISAKGDIMDNQNYNIQRYNRKKQRYRLKLGIQQLLNYPVLNIIWLLFGFGVMILAVVVKKISTNLEIHSGLSQIFEGCMKVFMILFPIICAVGVIQTIGNIFARQDEADLELVFGDKRNVKNQPPMLIFKKKDKKSGVIKREFYSTIPLEQWKEKKEALCDRMDIHLIGDITYGGRKKDKGNCIYFESAKGRIPMGRGVLYDDIF